MFLTIVPISDTVGNPTESTTVDGINLAEIKEFAKQFKIRRLSLGLTQTQVRREDL
jgi:class 6 POU domain transcription factor